MADFAEMENSLAEPVLTLYNMGLRADNRLQPFRNIVRMYEGAYKMSLSLQRQMDCLCAFVAFLMVHRSKLAQEGLTPGDVIEIRSMFVSVSTEVQGLPDYTQIQHGPVGFYMNEAYDAAVTLYNEKRGEKEEIDRVKNTCNSVLQAQQSRSGFHLTQYIDTYRNFTIAYDRILAGVLNEVFQYDMTHVENHGFLTPEHANPGL